MRSSMVRWSRFAMGLGVTVFFLWLLWRQVDIPKAAMALSRISFGSLAAALAFLAADYTVRIIRWWLMLRALNSRIALSACAWPFLVSIAVNNLLPFRAGDALRMVGFRSQLNLKAMEILGTLVIERLLDLTTLLAFFFIGIQFIAGGRIPDVLIRLATWMFAIGGIIALVIVIFSGHIEIFIRRLAERSFLANRKWTDLFKGYAISFLGSLGILRAPALGLKLVALSVVVWTLEGAVFATVAKGLAIPTTLGPWFALSTGTLGTLLPSSPGYIGTFDYFTMLGLVAYGAVHDLAAAFAFIIHLVLWLPLTLVGASYFIIPRARALRLREAATIAAQQEDKG